ncbi:cilia- and flagella-associated protein 46-like [Ylistrum balloti]|uniref:cilia- and flagella-associated protein 46-like n=1 Tax=Ylistrum balloti TaxID=509963 RepID=UPI002905A154|nr:cilia- and flagella-associated protein 46-like [Ylistrum balloti]
MDISIRKLLTTAQKLSGPDNPPLSEAFEVLRNVAENKPSVDAPEAFGQDLYVICAEISFQNGLYDMARDCLKMFFMKPPPANQFLCRAYLCQAQLLAPQKANNPEQLEKAVVYLLKAISFAKKNVRYHFLVYNASVIYWQFCRPFLKPNYKQFLARGLHQVVRALDDIDDKDFEWRAQLMIALIECHLDAGKRNDAASIANPAVTFIKTNVPHLYKKVFGIIVRNQLLESAKLHKDVKNSAELAVYYKILKLKVSVDLNEQREYYSEVQRILNQMGVTQGGADDTNAQKTEKGRGKKGGRTAASPTPGSRLEDDRESPQSQHSEVSQSVFLDSELRSPSKAGRRTPTPTSTKKLAADSPDKPFLLLELGRFCLDLDFADLAQDCVNHMKSCVVKEAGFYLELELLECDLMLHSLGDKQESYQKSVIDLRLQAIKRCEETIMNAIRHGDPNVIQAACVTQWNLCLPLLQLNLRNHARKPLTLVAEALEDIESLLISLRCQVHTELAKCEEDQEQIQVAMDNLKKALALDDGNVYRERLEVSLRRLELRSQLYQQPERPEDIAAMIIEQARKADSGTIRMKRSLLVKAGEALAPDAFLLVLDSESDTKENKDHEFTDVTGGKAPLTQIKKLSNKARQFNKCVKKAAGHLKRLGDENDRERARLWGDLAKTARKQQVWDVCRVAARFCLLYDDGRWKNVLPEKKMESPKPEKRRDGGASSSMGAAGESSMRMVQESSMKMGQESATGGPKESVMSTLAEGATSYEGMEKKGRNLSRPTSPERFVPLYDKDLIRMLAEVSFVQGEAIVHLLRSEGVELNDMPIPPVDKSKRPKGYVAKKPEEDPDWIEYCDWIKLLTEDGTQSFLRGLELGVELIEPWLVCSAGAYIWNYNNHLLTQLRHREIMDTLSTVVTGLRKIGHAGETVMLVNICTALAYAYMKPWIPAEPSKDGASAPTPVPSPEVGKKGKPAAAGAAKSKPVLTVSINPEAAPDLKKAIEVCEYAIDVTNGSVPLHVVPIAARVPLLQTWVLAKQMAQVQIPKTLGADDEPYTEGQRQMTRAIVAMEMLTVNRNGIMEFKDTPTIAEVANWLDECTWSDKFMELQMWTRLTSLAYAQKLHAIVVRCSKQAIRFATVGTQPKNRKMEAHRYMVEQEMLSYASGLLGQSLVDNMAGKNAIRREAMEAFLNSARFARNADNYEMVMTAARHYWNACMPLVSQPIERELLREPIKAILFCITTTAESVRKAEEKQEDKENEEEDGGTGAEVAVDDKPQSSTIGSPEDDLTLRASLYGVLFQSYADKKQWEEGLAAMDQAITDMPRTKHRLLIFKHRVMTKAKLGRSVNMDIQKFKDESEDYVAHMWRRVALSSKEILEQLISYQAAVEALNSASNEWQKVDLLLEFGQWLYYNEFPLQDAVDQIEWAVDIILNMRTDTEIHKERAAVQRKLSLIDSNKKMTGKAASVAKKAEKKGKGKSSAKGKATPAPPSKLVPVADTPRKSPEPKKAAKSMDSRSETSSVSDDINPDGYIPVAKQAIIGVLPNNPGLKFQDLEDVKQIDGLLRAYILLAEIAGRSSVEYQDFLLMCHSFIMRLWQVSVPVTGPIIKEMAKAAAAAGTDAKSDAASAKNKKKEKDAPAAPVKEKPKRKGPIDALPSNTEEWAVYDAPDEVVEAFSSEQMKVNGINSSTIVKPMLTLHYLDTLIRMLREVGYNHLTLPVFALEDVMSRNLLKNNALNTLIHSRAAEVCLELNLKNGIMFHERLAGPLTISEDDQSLCRDEIAIWKERQIQVAKEEMRVKESLANLAAESTQSQTRKSVTSHLGQSSIDTKSDEQPLTSHLGKVLSAVTFRDVWADMAQLLINQCGYQAARQYLDEAHKAAVAFDDHQLEARILFLFGRLALAEAQYGQAFNFCREAQNKYQGDEMFWYDTTMLMVDATLKDYENRNSKRIARGILVHALNEFMRIADERPNRVSVTQFIIAKMEARLAFVQSKLIFEEDMDMNEPKVLKRLLDICEKYENACDKLTKLGYKREVLPIMKDHADILIKMAKKSIHSEKEVLHTYYLQSMGVLRDAVAIAEEVYRDVQTLASLQELRNLSLPIQRELADIKVHCGSVMLAIFQEHAKEARETQLEDIRKGAVVKMVEDFIRETPTYTHMEKEWVDTTRTVIEDAMLKFVDAHNMAAGIPKLRTKALCGIGQSLKAFSVFSCPNSGTQWSVYEEEISKLESSSGEGEEDEGEKPELDETSKLFVRYSVQMKETKAAEDVSRHYLLQATECLVQALNLALNKHYNDLAATISLELVECCGQYDPQACSMFLALYQSCCTSLKLETLLNKAQVDPMTSRLAALLHQRSDILENDISTNMSSGSLMTSVQTSLEQNWQAWKRLEVMPTHLDLIKEFPANFNFIILQHSPDKNFLYGAILDKPKNAPVAGGGKNPKTTAPQASSRAKVFGIQVNPDMLESLLTKFADHRQAIQALLLKQEYARAQAMMRQKMLENLDESLKQKTQTLHLDEDAEEEAMLLEEFDQLIKDMESYLQPITTFLQGMLNTQVVTPASGKEAKNAPVEPPPSIECAILLVDNYLMQLPLEALEFLQVENVASLSRDFSLQLFYHRFFKEEVPTGDHVKFAADSAKDVNKKKPKGQVDNPMSRIPGLRDASKKMAKIVPLTREIAPWQHAVDTMNFRYIVDTHLDCAETEVDKPIDVINRLIDEYDQQFTPRWLGIMGDDHTPSVGEWEIYLTENSSFIFYGMEKFLNYIPPAKLTALNIPDCSILYIQDLAQTSKSFTRQSKLDVLKSASILALEKPVETAMLVSLTGIKCLMANQWHCALAENANRLKTNMKDMLEGGKTTGEALRLLFTPYRRRKPEEDKPTEEAEEKESHREDERDFSDRDFGAKEELPEPEMSWYNTVCYGLPNIVVTQLSGT